LVIQKRYRGKVSRKFFHREVIRKHIAKEILETETTYVNQLQILINEFMPSLGNIVPIFFAFFFSLFLNSSLPLFSSFFNFFQLFESRMYQKSPKTNGQTFLEPFLKFMSSTKPNWKKLKPELITGTFSKKLEMFFWMPLLGYRCTPNMLIVIIKVGHSPSPPSPFPKA